MTDAFVNIVVEGDAGATAETIAEVVGVSAAHHVRGEFDVVAALELSEPGVLQQVVTGSIQSVDGVENTTTVVTPELAERHVPEAERVPPDR
jgi:DNA-binding Lrp family transcriptional regulator